MGRIHCLQMLRRCSDGMRVAALLPVLALCTLTAWNSEQIPVTDESVRPAFKEIWAYLLRGEEKELTGTEPITDLCYFGAGMTKDGRITDTVARPVVTLKGGLKPAIHLVIAELSNPALMHFSLDPGYGVRPLLIEDICRIAEGFDGVQIDFESVSRDDADHFYDFLKELRSRLPAGKKLSVAVPARTKLIADAYDYSRIAPIVDRMVIMAYDEHWSTSSPGPVASLPWCSTVVDYAKSTVESAKIVMGLPLYGRAWQDKKLAKALRFRNVQDLVAEKKSTTNYAPELGAYFEYSESVVVTVFYDDHRSIMDKLQLYRARDINSVSFWRIGQGPPQLWGNIENAGSENMSAASDRGAKSSPDDSQASAGYNGVPSPLVPLGATSPLPALSP
jgi:spore germination protein